ncbi:MAG TPA: hypothetical protein DCE71_00225 [Parachlamydiales bacterium]|nr:hypothetical protein [Parachlamydiales bacterium]
MHEKEKNPMMQALNSMKSALSQIEKEYTMMQGTRTGDQDGNMSQAVDGEVDYDNDFKNVKRKMLVKKLQSEG